VVVSCLISADVVLTLTLKLAVKYEVLPVFVRDILAITLGLFLVFTIVIFAVMAAFLLLQHAVNAILEAIRRSKDI
jgi:hypothetical protein